MKHRTPCFLAVLLVLAVQTATAQVLVKDQWPGGESSSPKEFFALDGVTYFAGDQGDTGIELYRTDGTSGGTFLVKDINPVGSSDPAWLTGSTGLLFFRANDGTHGDEVWVTDGTADGTHMTKDIYPGTEGSHPEHIAMLNGRAYFMAQDGANGMELWTSDGTEAGTFMLVDLNPGPGDGSPHWFLEHDGWLYFRGNDGVHGDELWKTRGVVGDGGGGGVGGDGGSTRMIKDIYEGPESSTPERLVSMGGLVYFPATDAVYGAELWVSNGTPEGTHIVKDINTAGSGDPKGITVAGGQLFFAAENGIAGAELWASDGTEAGTRLVKDVREGDSPSLPNDLTAVGNTLFFTAFTDMPSGTSLWKSDGTEAGTVMVKDLRSDGEPAFMYLTELSGTGVLAFTAIDGINGVELWRSDGTPGGTYLTRDISPGIASSAPLSLTDVNGVLYFSATDQVYGRELWTYDPLTPPEIPVARSDAGTTEDGIAIQIDVLVNDTGEAIGITVVGDPSNGTAVLVDGPNSPILYSPTPGFTGTDTFAYTITDEDGETDFAQVTVTVNPTNTPPTISAVNDVSTDEDVPPEDIQIIIGDAQTTARDLVVTASSNNQVLLPDANIVVDGGMERRGLAIVTAPNENGEVDITLTVSDGVLETSTTFTLTVNPVNDAPTIAWIDNQTTVEDTPAVVGFTVADVDSPVEELTVTGASDKTRLLAPAGIETTGADEHRTVRLTPEADEAGFVTVTLTVSDGSLSSTRAFELTVTAVDAPSITGLDDVTTAQGVPVGPRDFEVGDASTAPGALVVSAASDNPVLLPNGNITLGGANALRNYTLEPTADAFGTADVTFTVTDGDGHSNDARITLTVVPDNRPPVAVDDAYRIAEGATLIITPENGVLANDTDPDGDVLSAWLVAPPDHGELTLNADGSFTYVPDPTVGEPAPVFSYQATDGVFGSNPAYVTINIGENLPPTISEIPDQVGLESEGIEISRVIIRDDMSHGGEMLVVVTSDNQALIPDDQIIIHGGGDVRVIAITFVNDVWGEANITITVTDAEGLSASRTFKVTVLPVNDPPAISDLANQVVLEDTPVTDLPFTVSDEETAAGALLVSATSDNQVLLPDANVTFGGSEGDRTLTATPAANASGVAVVMVTVSDGELTTSETFTLTVIGVDAPEIFPIPDQVVGENSTLGPVEFDVIPQGPKLPEFVLSALVADPLLLPEGSIVFGGEGTNRTITITPAPDMNGQSRVTVVAEDVDGNPASFSFLLTVVPANQPPVATGEAYTFAGTALFTISAAEGVLANDSDPNGDELTAILVEPPYAGTLVLNGDGSFTYQPAEETEEEPHAHKAGDVEEGAPVDTPPTDMPPGETGPPEGHETEDPLTFSYVAFDGRLQSNVATVTLIAEHGSGIGSIADVEAVEGDVVGPLDFTVQPGKMTVVAHSSNQSILSDANIELAGMGRNRTVTMSLTPGMTGVVTVTLASSSGTADTSFRIFVLSMNAPTLEAIPDQTIHVETGTLNVPLAVDDPNDGPDALGLSANSSNPTLLPQSGMLFGGNGRGRWIRLSPAQGQTGSSQITVSVTDGAESSSRRFTLHVVPMGTPVGVEDSYDIVLTEPLVVGPGQGVLSNDWDPEGDPLSANLVDPPASGQVQLNADGSFVYTPTGLEAGKDAEAEASDHDIFFTYEADDGTHRSAVTKVYLASSHTDEMYISPIEDVSTPPGVPTSPIRFAVTPGMVTVSVSSSNHDLLPIENIMLPSKKGRWRTITLTPVPGRVGWSDVTLVIVNRDKTASTTFRFSIDIGGRAGDINGDTEVDVADAVSMLRYIVQLDPDIALTADVTGDGNVNVTDVVSVMRYIVQLIPCFPIDTICPDGGAGKLDEPVKPNPVLADASAYELDLPIGLDSGTTSGFELKVSYDRDWIAMASVDLDLPGDWLVVHNDVDGQVHLVAAGITPIKVGSLGHLTFRAIAGGESSIEGRLVTAEGAEQEVLFAPAEDIPTTFELEGNFPNPFNPTTTIQYTLPEVSDVSIEVFSVLGRKVAVLFSGRQPAGRHRLNVRADDWPTGLYLYRVQAGNQHKTSSMLLIK